MIESKLLNQFSNIRHGFGSKIAVTPEPQPWLLKQIHSDRWYELDGARDEPPSETVKADAVITTRRGRAMAIQTADCVPLLMNAPQAGIIVAIHAGWKGTAMKLASKMVHLLRAEKGVDVSDIFVAIGPCIQQRHYEVGEEVIEANRWLASHATPIGGSPPRTELHAKFLLNLPAANRQLLFDAGVPSGNIDVIDFCTFERDDLFFSYRRDGARAGRQISWIMLL